jgi:hypothetical protein
MKPLTIRVHENSSPVIVLALTQTDDDDNKTPLDLTGANPVQMFIKTSPDAPDGQPVYSYPNNGIVILEPRTAGRIAIAFQASDIPIPARKFFKVVVTIGTITSPRAYGLLAVGNV